MVRWCGGAVVVIFIHSCNRELSQKMEQLESLTKEIREMKGGNQHSNSESLIQGKLRASFSSSSFFAVVLSLLFSSCSSFFYFLSLFFHVFSLLLFFLLFLLFLTLVQISNYN